MKQYSSYSDYKYYLIDGMKRNLIKLANTKDVEEKETCLDKIWDVIDFLSMSTDDQFETFLEEQTCIKQLTQLDELLDNLGGFDAK